jgi:Undecaprenyl-phosphate galactose phosphotransferase WbaP
LALSDGLVVLILTYLATAAMVSMGAVVSIGTSGLWGIVLAAVSLCIVTFYVAGLYRNVGMHPVEELERVVTTTAIVFITLLWIFVWRNDQAVWGEIVSLCITGFACILVLPSWRHLLRCRLGKTDWWRKPVVIIGSPDRADSLFDELEEEGHLGWRPVGCILDFHENWDHDRVSKRCLGVEEELPQIAEKHDVFWGMIDTNAMLPSDVQGFMDRNHRALPNIVSVTGNAGDTTLLTRGLACGNSPGVHFRSMLSLLLPSLLKRTFDFTVATLILLLLAPLLAVLAIAVRLGSPGPIFYSQERIGLHGRTFRIWKFRSMVQNADYLLRRLMEENHQVRDEWQRTQKLSRDPRITGIGRFLRKTSLDEIPQLFNVLTGSMSLVGPRPMERNEPEKYGDVYWLYIRTRPGITGLWQVNGRNKTSYEERLRYVSFYVRNWSIWLDWYILLRTFRVVVLCEGAC